MALPQLLDRLEAEYGPPPRAFAKGPLAMIVLENVAYLVDDERRRAKFELLKQCVGIDAEALLAAPDEVLLEICTGGGMHPEQRVRKLRAIGALARESGDLGKLLKTEPPAAARRVLEKFPGIGDPGADKILLFCGADPVVALDSNALRVLLRLGYGTEHKSYAASYRSAVEAAGAELPRRQAARVRAYELLRRHGQETCRRTAPACGACPLLQQCPSGKAR